MSYQNLDVKRKLKEARDRHRLKHPEKTAEYTLRWRTNNPENYKASNRKRREAHLEYLAIWRFNMTKARYEKMLVAQCGSCACCGEAFQEGQRIDVDHDHRCCPTPKGTPRKTCGKCVRALLCRGCNIAVGFYERKAQDVRVYLSAH